MTDPKETKKDENVTDTNKEAKTTEPSAKTETTTPKVETPNTSAAAVDKTEEVKTSTDDAITAKLKSLNVNQKIIDEIKDKLGVTDVSQLSKITEADLTTYTSMPIIPARDLVDNLRPAPSTEAIAPTGQLNPVTFDSVLPSVPTDESWLEALKIGGVLKVEQSSVIAGTRAALAHRGGLFEIPGILVKLMEDFADQNNEQVDPEFFKLRKQMTRRAYADVFAAIDGLDGSYVTEKRKNMLFERIDQFLWPAIFTFYDQLKTWQEAWLQGTANPAAMMNSMMALIGGGGTMPPGIIQSQPDTGVLRDCADQVADAINKVFAGTGVQITAAIAYDAARIKETLSNPRLPALIGASNRDQMLTMLGVSVPATYPRLEQNLTRFVLSILQAKDQPAGNAELQFFGTLFMLGSQITWDQLRGGSYPDRRDRNNERLTGIGTEEQEKWKSGRM